MPILRVNRQQNDGAYFITPTVRSWYYIFDRHDRWDILAGSIRHCQKHKGLEVYAYVFMLNHLHMIVRSPDVAGFLRDFKHYTAYALQKNIAATEPNLLDLFMENNKFSLWKQDNKPIGIETEEFFLQKSAYICFNPVRKGYVERPEYWRWSSANPNSPIAVSAP
jgi:putative transposase